MPDSTVSTGIRSVGKYPQIAVSRVVFSTALGASDRGEDVTGAASLSDVMGAEDRPRRKAGPRGARPRTAPRPPWRPIRLDRFRNKAVTPKG
ncbi:hypothetical protein GCM10022226_13640 [Sphaerisporangium flaviroseum]|uniref:Uncharacterized protein n=1 Tax=Sphaerisporangium flaviroseum TaxID=509199 RepID=A0ABP7HRD2_9ACTN